MPPNKGNLTMAFLSVTAPKSTLDLSGHSGDTAIAYGDGDTINSGGQQGNFGANSPGAGNTIYLVGQNQTFIGNSGYIGGGRDHVAVYGDSNIAKISNSSVTTFGHGDTVNISGWNIADHATAFGSSSVAAMGDSSVFVTCTSGVMSFIGGSGFSVVLAGGALSADVNFGEGGGVAVGGEEEVIGRPHDQFYGQNTLVAGLKASTLYGSNHGTNDLVASGSAGDGLVGGENSYNRLDASNSTGNNYMEGHQGLYTAPAGTFNNGTPSPANIMLGGGGNDVMVAGSGYNEMHAGSGVDTFLVINSAMNQVGGGNQVMLDAFKQGTDHLDLVGYAGSTDALLASAQHFGGGTQLQMADGAHLNVAGVNLTTADIWRQG